MPVQMSAPYVGADVAPRSVAVVALVLRAASIPLRIRARMPREGVAGGAFAVVARALAAAWDGIHPEGSSSSTGRT
ncbi:hypothetical protein [Microbacterium terregens]|uniref:Uncharacterized protein n=2 Tax=Microbacterium terregens TaxID=69363 RepID=A0ABV5T5L5_9MICO